QRDPAGDTVPPGGEPPDAAPGPWDRPEGFEGDGEHVVEDGVDGPFPHQGKGSGDTGGEHAENEEPPRRPDGAHAEEGEGEQGPAPAEPGEGARLSVDPRPPISHDNGGGHRHPGQQPPDHGPVDGQHKSGGNPGQPGSRKNSGRQRNNGRFRRRQRPHQNGRRGQGNSAPGRRSASRNSAGRAGPAGNAISQARPTRNPTSQANVS